MKCKEQCLHSLESCKHQCSNVMTETGHRQTENDVEVGNKSKLRNGTKSKVAGMERRISAARLQGRTNEMSKRSLKATLFGAIGVYRTKTGQQRRGKMTVLRSTSLSELPVILRAPQ